MEPARVAATRRILRRAGFEGIVRSPRHASGAGILTVSP